MTFARIGRCVVAHHRDGAAKCVTGLIVPASDRNTPPARALAPAGFAVTSLRYRSESRESLNGLLGQNVIEEASLLGAPANAGHDDHDEAANRRAIAVDVSARHPYQFLWLACSTVQRVDRRTR